MSGKSRPLSLAEAARGKRVTIRDVAREANCSVTTVSKVLNKPPEQLSISEPTRQRVLEVCKRLGYRPNPSARFLRSGKSHLIGVSIVQFTDTSQQGPQSYDDQWWDESSVPDNLRRFDPHIMENFSSEIIGLGQMLRGFMNTPDFFAGWELVLHARREYLDRQFTPLDLQIDMFDGLLYITPTARHEEYLELAEEGFPIVVVGSVPEGANVVSVDMDNVSAGRMPAEHMRDIGCRNLYSLYPYDRDLTLTLERSRGVNEVWSQVAGGNLLEEWLGTEMSISKAYEMTRRALEEHPEIDGIYVGHSPIAPGVIYAIESVGRKVPGDIAVMGVGDWIENLTFNPQISCLDVPIEYFCRIAFQQLMKLIRGEELEDRRIRVQPGLIIRESTSGFKPR